MIRAEFGDDAANSFAVGTFSRMLRDDPDGNWVFSPASLWFVLAMAADGAEGRTRDEMLSAMSLPDGTNPAIATCGSLRSASGVRMGNMVLCHEGYGLVPEFVERCRANFSAEAWTRNLGDPRTVEDVNRWVSDVTVGKIPALLGGLDPLVRLILINAIYFKGTWVEPFKDAVPAYFHHPSGRSDCLMMKREKGDLRYGELPNFRVVRIPYADRRSSMVLALPNEGHTPASVLGHVLASGWRSVWDGMRETKVEVQLPRFRVERTMERELMQSLHDIGMREAFSVRDSDFSRMTPSNDLYVQSIIQKALIEVDEQGTEAAAATAMQFALRSVSLGPIQIVFDRPFVYAIVDEVTGVITFIGVVNRP